MNDRIKETENQTLLHIVEQDGEVVSVEREHVIPPPDTVFINGMPFKVRSISLREPIAGQPFDPTK